MVCVVLEGVCVGVWLVGGKRGGVSVCVEGGGRERRGGRGGERGRGGFREGEGEGE